jgi:hypothetical protein
MGGAVIVGALFTGLSWLFCGAVAARWNYSYFRTKGINEGVARKRLDPVKYWEEWDRFDVITGSVLAFLAGPLYVILAIIVRFVASGVRKTDYEKELELAAARKKIDEMEKEAKRLQKLLGA